MLRKTFNNFFKLNINGYQKGVRDAANVGLRFHKALKQVLLQITVVTSLVCQIFFLSE